MNEPVASESAQKPAPPTAVPIGMVLPDLQVGGAERLLVDMVSSWKRHEDALTTVVYAFRDGPARDALEALGCRVHLAPSTRRVNPLLVPWLARRFVSDGIRLVHAHLPRAGVYARLAARLVGVPVLYTEHSLTDRHHRLSDVLNRTTYPLNRHVVAVSRAVEASVGDRTLPPGRLSVIYNGVPPRDDVGPSRRGAARRSLALPPGVPVVGTVANLRPDKGIDHLLGAVASLNGSFPSLHCVVIGRDDGEGAHLRRIASETGLTGRTRWPGFRADARELLPALDVFVLPSLHEGMPVALIEAMDASLPSVASDVGGVAEIVVDRECGLLVPPGDRAALADALRPLLADETVRRRMGNAARVRVRDVFTVDRMARQYADLYRTLVPEA